MITKVIKRNNEVEKFDKSKIIDAIFSAAQSVGGDDKKRAESLADVVIERLNEKFSDEKPPTIDDVNDATERILIKNGHARTAKAFILNRQQAEDARKMRDLFDPAALVDSYLDMSDWRVKENSNMAYSLQGLNNHIASDVVSNYWLMKIYPPEIRKAHKEADLHIHDLASLCAYCCGWDLKDFIQTGFKGVPGKITCKPPKHLSTALGQLVNIFYTLQGETAGAEAVSNLDTYMAPFIRYDGLIYNEVKQAVQEFLFNMNVPTRVGFQCISDDTEVLTSEGWKKYTDVKSGMLIKTFNIKNKQIEDKKVKSVFKKHYTGIMYNLKNRIQDQLVSPNHRVVRRKFQTDRCVLEPIEQIVKYKSPVIVPVAAINNSIDFKISDEQIKLMAWIIAEGSTERPLSRRCCYRITIYQSKIKNRKKYDEIIALLKHFKLNYSEKDSTPALGSSVKMIRLDAESSKKIHDWFGTKERIHFIPLYLLRLSLRQAKLFLDTYLKAEGSENCKISTTDADILEGLQVIAVNAGYASTVLKRDPTIGTKPIFVLRLIKHHETYISSIKKVHYDGVIWCPNTENETVIAKRNGKVFITGNTPFTNVTMDLTTPDYLKEQQVIIGGELKKDTYDDFGKERDMFNRAFAEVLQKGDAAGGIFSFPIPTYNLYKGFDWNNDVVDYVMEMTAKYGIPYFANFIHSDMKPEDATSMCPLAGDEKVLIKSSRGREVEYASIRYIYEGNSKKDEYEVYSDGKFVKGKFNKFENQKMLEVTLENGHSVKMSEEHLNFVKASEGEKDKITKGKDLECGMYLPYSLKSYEGQGGNKELGYFVGAYASDGSFDRNTSVVFSLENHFKKGVITKLENIARKYFGAHSTITQDKKTKLVTLKIHSKAAVGLCRDFVEDKKRSKHYTAKIFTTSIEFRGGVLEGHYATNGGNRHRIYTSSPFMVESLNMLAATLGTTTCIYKDSRQGRLGTEPNYAVLFYQLNRKKYGNIWFKNSGKLWVKIKSIKQIPSNTAYCFEVKTGSPIFTIGTTGILTHNCRLRLDRRELRKRGGGLFASYPLTGCYDDKTEILTANGWKFFKDLTKADPIFTLTTKNDIEVHNPTKLFEYEYDDEMYHFKSKSIDLLVTPNHNMVVDQTYKNKRKFIEAQDFNVGSHRIPKKSNWNGKEKEWFILPYIEFTKYGKQGRTPYSIVKSELKIKMDTWLKFFGFWLAEGCTDNEHIAKRHGYRVVVTQVNAKNRIEFEKVLQDMPFNYCKEKHNFVICNKQLWSYLRQFGKKYDKFVPSEILALSRSQLKILFEWMVKGDGHVRKTNGQINYWTCSKKLADNLQEVILKLGYLGTLTIQNGKVSVIKGRKVKSNTMYVLGVQQANHYRLRKRNVHKVFYKGKVYCCEVPNHTVFVRRNGRVSWCGNSIGVVTINLPKIGYLAKDETDYFERLESIMYLAKDSLEIKRKAVERFTQSGLYPYARFYLSKIQAGSGEYWKNHFSTIGIFGMNESLLNFMETTIATKEGKKFALKAMDFMRDHLSDFQEKTGNIYNLEATPAEGVSYRFANTDKKNYPDIIAANEKAWKENKAAPFYTNSTNLPVDYTDDIFEALELQQELQAKYTGGTVFHGFIGEKMPSAESTKKLVKRIAENFTVPYFSITPTFSVCPSHNYISGQHEFCPTCDDEVAQGKPNAQQHKCEVYSRVVGYIRPVSQWHAAKQQEFKMRKTYDRVLVTPR